MRSVRLSWIILVCVVALLANGCNSSLRDCRIQNETQRNRIAQTESELATAQIQLEQCRRQLDSAQTKGGLEGGALREKIQALEEDLAKKKELIAAMQERLLYGGAPLPVELTTKLEDFAEDNDMVEYDSARGVVKFKSDLLFEKGSDQVTSAAGETVKSLCGILNSEEAQSLDILIAGHTDDIPIKKPATRAKHPTNWHLSAHRSISVLDVMANNGIVPRRMSVRGFGEYRPVEPNKPSRGGNQKNRRVEVFIIPEGA